MDLISIIATTSSSRCTDKDFVARKKFRLIVDLKKQTTLTATDNIIIPDDINTFSETRAKSKKQTSSTSEFILLSDSSSSYRSELTCTSLQANETSFANFRRMRNSPPLYSTSTSNTTAKSYSNRPKRGRPFPKHRNRFDASYLAQLTEKERKYWEKRYKHNEACRQLRIKRRQLEEAEIMEEERLQHINAELKIKLLKYSHIAETLNNIANKRTF
ncbi:uncharacterized protein LOC119685655 [Teleopsis dalmanni]|uniref:uncharacterized protein LOC119685655 n=1 Tax=Teleopsis dalmanni TaxID=139649 RepID=UPI0018CE513B|nr:uncharacterized protein LOC119685655 [Teleopsis dalmanni]